MPFVVEGPLFPWQRPTAPLDGNVAASQSHEKPSWQTPCFLIHLTTTALATGARGGALPN